MIFRRSRWHYLGLGQHRGGHRFQSLHHFVGTQRGGFAVDDERHGPTREHDGTAHLAHAWNAGQRIVGIVGWIGFQKHGHVIDKMTILSFDILAFTFYLDTT